MASKRAKRRRACAGKAAHATMQAAWVARRQMATTARLSAYRCPFCGQWHLGHTPKAVRQAVAARQRGEWR